ncbi:MAG: hypothetical protein AAFP02_09745, partial [Bacteroidota bacterium]
MKNLSLSFPRLGLLLRNDLRTFGRPVLLGSALVFVFLQLAYQVQMQDFAETVEHFPERTIIFDFHEVWFGTLLLICGFVFSSFAFFELHRKESGMQYLLLPASPIEKWLSRYLITSIGFALYFFLLYGLSSLVCDALGKPIWGVEVLPFEWFGDDTWMMIAFYL